jgi:hypothetical protein
MDVGSALLLFGLDIELLQGIVNHLYESDPTLRSVDGGNGLFHLDLDPPAIETRADGAFRMGVHLTGRLFVGAQPDPLVFDTWVRLRPELVGNPGEIPAGALRFDAVEDVVPAGAEQPVADAFGPDGFIGKTLDTLTIPVFADLLASANDQLFPDAELDVSRFSTAFYLGRSAPIRRPVWTVRRANSHWEPSLDLDVTYATVPALMAAVGPAGADPVPPDAPSVVRSGTGLGLVTSAGLLAQRFARESEAVVGTKLQDLTIDRLDVSSTDWGFDVDGEGHKTGAEVDFSGSLVVQFRGGVGGEIVMRSTVETDVDTAWWVDLLSVVAALVPGLGWFLGDLLIWGPVQEAPGKVEAALLDQFSTPLASAAQQLATAFGLEGIPTSAFLADVWFFDGNLAVTAAAFAGRRTEEVQAVTHDVAYLAADPGGAGKHTNRRRPVSSVAEITLSGGHALKPWQAGQLVHDGLLRIPGHHAVSNPLAKGGVYLRSNPDDTTSNNLLA